MGAEEYIGGTSPFALAQLVPGCLKSDQKIDTEQKKNRQSIYRKSMNYGIVKAEKCGK